MSEITLPDIRVVSVILDNDTNSLRVNYDDDEMGGLEALGILVAGTFRHLVQMAEADITLDDEDEDEDGEDLI